MLAALQNGNNNPGPMPEAEEERCKAGMPREKIAEERIWNNRPDGFAIKMPTSAKMGEFVILDFKRMSDVTDQYMTRAKLNAQDLYYDLAYFKVPQAGIESIRSKLVFKIFDEYANILKGMYNTKFNGRPKDSDVYTQTDSAPGGPMPPLITSLQAINVQSHRWLG